jgi:chromosome segregation ATPase
MSEGNHKPGSQNDTSVGSDPSLAESIAAINEKLGSIESNYVKSTSVLKTELSNMTNTISNLEYVLDRKIKHLGEDLEGVQRQLNLVRDEFENKYRILNNSMTEHKAMFVHLNEGLQSVRDENKKYEGLRAGLRTLHLSGGLDKLAGMQGIESAYPTTIPRHFKPVSYTDMFDD